MAVIPPRGCCFRHGFDAKTRRASVVGLSALKPMLHAGCRKTSSRWTGSRQRWSTPVPCGSFEKRSLAAAKSWSGWRSSPPTRSRTAPRASRSLPYGSQRRWHSIPPQWDSVASKARKARGFGSMLRSACVDVAFRFIDVAFLPPSGNPHQLRLCGHLSALYLPLTFLLLDESCE
jgi:hypothetical protein